MGSRSHEIIGKEEIHREYTIMRRFFCNHAHGQRKLMQALDANRKKSRREWFGLFLAERKRRLAATSTKR